MKKIGIILLYLTLILTVWGVEKEKTIISYIGYRTGGWSIKESKNELKMISDMIKKGEFNENKIYIYGYTDRTGDPSINKHISKKRVDEVYDYFLNDAKIPKEKLVTKHFGDSNPIDNRKNQEAYRKNRRVEIFTYINKNEMDELRNSIMEKYKKSKKEETKFLFYYDFLDWAVSRYYREINAIIDLIKKDRINIKDIKIEGHTDSLGYDKGNLEVSKLRAKSVYQYFWYNNLDADKITTEYLADKEPLGKDPSKNRRVELIINRILSDKKELKNFSVGIKSEEIKINKEEKIVDVKIPYSIKLENLDPIIDYIGERIKPEKLKIKGFDIPIEVNIYAEDGSSIKYKINISKMDPKIDRVDLILNKSKINLRENLEIDTKVYLENGKQLKDYKQNIYVDGKLSDKEIINFEKTGIYKIYAEVNGIKSEVKSLEVVRKIEKDKPPIIKAIGRKVIVENESFKIKIDVTDPNNDSIDLKLIGGEKGMKLEGNILKWKPNFNQAGEYRVTVVAQAKDKETKQDIEIKVKNKDRSPVIKDVTFQVIKEQEELIIPLEVKDPDGDKVKLELRNKLEGMELEENNLKWKPDYNQAGEYKVTVVAQAKDKETKQDIKIEVKNKIKPVESVILSKIDKNIYAGCTKVKFKVNIIFTDNKKEKTDNFDIYINEKKIDKDDYIPKKFGKYQVYANREGLKSNEIVMEVMPSYERYEKKGYIGTGYKTASEDFVELGISKEGKLISMYPGRGDIYEIGFQYNLNSFFEMELRGKNITVVPRYKMDDFESKFRTRGLNLNGKVIPLRFNNSRLKFGGGIYLTLYNKFVKKIELEETDIDEEFTYENSIGYNFMAEYEYFLKEDKMSITLGTEYEDISSKFEDGTLNGKNVEINDLKSDYQVFNMQGIEYYLRLGYRF